MQPVLRLGLRRKSRVFLAARRIRQSRVSIHLLADARKSKFFRQKRNNTTHRFAGDLARAGLSSNIAATARPRFQHQLLPHSDARVQHRVEFGRLRFCGAAISKWCPGFNMFSKPLRRSRADRSRHRCVSIHETVDERGKGQSGFARGATAALAKMQPLRVVHITQGLSGASCAQNRLVNPGAQATAAPPASNHHICRRVVQVAFASISTANYWPCPLSITVLVVEG